MTLARRRGSRAAGRGARAAGTGDEDGRWWLQAGTEQCRFCLAWFHYAEQYRCGACDAAMCSFCAHVVRQTYAVRCPDCGIDDKE